MQVTDEGVKQVDDDLNPFEGRLADLEIDVRGKAFI